MNVLSKIIFVLFSIIFSEYLSVGQDVNRSFKPNIFKYSEKEIPITFGVSGGIGPSIGLIGGGLLINTDIYHIYVGCRLISSPIATLDSGPDIYEDKSFYFGYRYRKKKFEFALGSGIGSSYFRKCKGGDIDGCANSDEGTYQTIPIIFEYSYFPIPYIGGTTSLNLSFSDKHTGFAILGGIKIGISRRPNRK